MVQLNRGRARDEQGVIAILVAVVTCVVIFGVAALVVDLGLARDAKQASQISSDASALAAVTALYPDSTGVPDFNAAVQAAKTYALKNYKVDPTTGWAGCADPGAQAYTPDPNNQCISFDSSTSPTKARVVMPPSGLRAGFGGVYGVSTYTIRSNARAIVSSPVSGTCSLCFLGGVSTNNTDFTVQAASIAVRGDIDSGPQSYWTASSILVTGQVNGQDPDMASNKFTPTPSQVNWFEDPLKSLVLPSTSGVPHAAIPNCNTTLQPGVYGNVHVGSNSTCTLAAGLYVINGVWDEQSSNSTFTSAGNAVTLYFAGGYYDGKNGDTILKSGAPGYEKLAIIYDRANTNSLYLQGGGASGITGGVYAPAAVMVFNGHSSFTFDGGPVVVGGADSVGNQSGVTVTNGQSVTLTSSPQPAWLDQ
jgi:Flp pilus assembly protein TadG